MQNLTQPPIISAPRRNLDAARMHLPI
jgi:hypothetical protein